MSRPRRDIVEAAPQVGGTPIEARKHRENANGGRYKSTIKAAVCLSRAWVIFRQMKAVQIGLGEVSVRRRKIVPSTKEGEPLIEIGFEEQGLDLGAALRNLELLRKELDRREADVKLAADGDRPTEARRTVDTNKLLEGFTTGPGPHAKKN